MRIVLASASPRRRELLVAAGYAFDCLSTDVDESVHAREAPAAYVRRLAKAKAARALELVGAAPASEDQAGVLVIAADTAVIVDDEILGKPAHDEDAARMLRRLAGRAHRVITGVSLRRGDRQLDHVEETKVVVRPLSEAEIAWYVSTGEGRDKAGAYAIQGRASRFVTRIDGSYSNVVGLPVAAVAVLIEQLS